MKKYQDGMSFRQYCSISMPFVITIILSITIATQVEGSRPVVRYHKVSITATTIIDQLKIAKAYSGPSKSGIGHAIMHISNVLHTNYKSKGFKISRAYSGPSRKGSGHGLTNLLRNLSSTPFKKFKTAKAYSGPSGGGTGH
ncbi:hypothetical protein TorRG33x02_195390 [Trema orientale]|uniref:Uncharacterized protein n=1 Tax=Trema orientale TaxID=63057 RepID=A0A2P5EGR3_TREOI|nr:hypothetical protein TorRG33x02_195390 [Trema orientale]